MRQESKLSRGEEIANAVTHGVAAMAALLSVPYVAVSGYAEAGAVGAVSKSIFIICIFLMLASSALYHSMEPDSAHKRVFRILDHIFIYFAIAGSYTPLAILVIGGSFGRWVLAFQWALVLIGSLYKALTRKPVGAVSLAFYLMMGWTAIVMLPSILRSAGSNLLFFVIAGGLFYSVGAIFYAKKGFRYYHMVWHIMIILGALSHFIAIVFQM